MHESRTTSSRTPHEAHLPLYDDDEVLLLLLLGIGTVTMDVGARIGAVGRSTGANDGATVVVVDSSFNVVLLLLVGVPPAFGVAVGDGVVATGEVGGAVEPVVVVGVGLVTFKPGEKVQVSGQSFRTIQSQGMTRVTNSSPNINSGGSSGTTSASHVTHAVKFSIFGTQGLVR